MNLDRVGYLKHEATISYFYRIPECLVCLENILIGIILIRFIYHKGVNASQKYKKVFNMTFLMDVANKVPLVFLVKIFQLILLGNCV